MGQGNDNGSSWGSGSNDDNNAIGFIRFNGIDSVGNDFIDPRLF
jgi:hypothetical protein